MKKVTPGLIIFHILLLSSCNIRPSREINLVDFAGFDTIINEKQVMLYTLRNKNGCVAQLTNLGGRWVSMWVPDRSGKMTDVVLGFNSAQEYLDAGEAYHGAIVGRVCGRINNATFELGGSSYHLAHNDGFGKPEKNHLHGGIDGFHRKVWDGSTFTNEEGEQGVIFSYTSRDGEEGYPGNLQVKVTYLLTCNNEMKVTFNAATDMPTIINLTNHSYFNLNGEGNGNILDHMMKIRASRYVECDRELIPTGFLKPVAGTPLDYLEFKEMGAGISDDHDQIFKHKGYAAAMVIDQDIVGSSKPVAESFSKASGILLSVFSDQPSLQIYNAWLFDGEDIGKSGKKYEYAGGFVMETQGFPDAPNQPDFPSIRLDPGETYNHECTYRFSLRN